MSRLALILLLAGAYVGCATRTPAPVAAPVRPEPASGGDLRILIGSGLTAREVVESAVAGSLVPGAGIVRTLASVDGPDGVCFTLGISGRYPGGKPVRPADLVADWETRLRDPRSALRWLLQDVRGVESLLDGSATSVTGLTARDRNLGICLRQAGHDFEERLSHPAMAHRGGTEAAGPGPFLDSGSGTLSANRDHVGRPPALERIRLVDSDEDPRLLFRLNEVDLALVHGRTAAALLDDGDPAVVLRRFDRWERRYFLWLDASRRWLNDPAFRVWLAESIDRDGLVRFLFDGRGRPLFSLSPAGSAEPVWAASTRRPFASPSQPRLTLDFDQADRTAGDIAARIRAELALAGVQIELRGGPLGELRRALARGETSIVLLAHRPSLADPVLGLLESVWWLGRGSERAVQRLLRASAGADDGMRADEAWLAEYELLTEVRLVPLVGLEAWLAGAAGLEGVEAGAAGRLDLERARWAR